MATLAKGDAAGEQHQIGIVDELPHGIARASGEEGRSSPRSRKPSAQIIPKIHSKDSNFAYCAISARMMGVILPDARTAGLFLFALTAGCTTYAPLPLEEASTILARPAPAILSEQASAIKRPWLKKAPVDLAAPLTPEGVAAIAVVGNPDLVALRARSGIADAQVFAAGLLPDPAISIGVEKVLSGPDTLLNIAGAIGLDLNALRRRAVTRTQAEAQARQVRLDIAWGEWQVAGAARLAAVRVTGLGAIAVIARASDEAAQRRLQRLTKALAAGDATATDVEAARLAAKDAGVMRRAAEQDGAVAQAELARLLGLPPETRIALAPVAMPPVPPTADALLQKAEAGRSDLAALREGYAAEEAALRLAVLDQFPALNLSLTPGRDSSGNTLLGPSVDFILPLWNRNRGGIALEKATRAVLKAEYAARLFATRAEIVAAVQGLALARRQLAGLVSGEMLLVQQTQATEVAARRGDIPAQTGDAARQLARDRALLRTEAELAIREQTIALELLSGTMTESWQ